MEKLGEEGESDVRQRGAERQEGTEERNAYQSTNNVRGGDLFIEEGARRVKEKKQLSVRQSVSFSPSFDRRVRPRQFEMN